MSARAAQPAVDPDEAHAALMDALSQMLGRLGEPASQATAGRPTAASPDPVRTRLQRRMQAGRPGLPRGMGKPGEVTIKFPVDVLLRRGAPQGVDEETTALLRFMQQVEPQGRADLAPSA